MYQSFPYLCEPLGDDTAQSSTDSTGIVPTSLLGSFPGLIIKALSSLDFVLCAVLGLALTVGSQKAGEKTDPLAGPFGCSMSSRVSPNLPRQVARLRSGSAHHSLKNLFAVAKVVQNDPNDDGTSGDPDDDDYSETSILFDRPGDKEVLISAWSRDNVCVSIDSECLPITWTVPLSASLPLLQQLRC